MPDPIPASRPLLSDRQALALLAAFVVPRLFLAAVSGGADYDFHSYLLVERAMRVGEPLYANPTLNGHYPYLPAWAWTLWALGWLGRGFGGPALLWFKLPGLAADAGLVLLLLAWPRPAGAEGGYRAALAYALSPVAWLVSAGHGQFDAVVLFFCAAAAFGWGRPGWAAGLRAGWWLGLAILFKSWPVLLLPVFWVAGERRARRGLLLMALALPALALAVYAWREGPAAVLARVAYAGSMGMGLPEALGRLVQRWGNPAAQDLWDQAWGPFSLVVLGLGCLWPLRTGPRPTWPAALAGLLLGLLVLAPALAVQYLLWPLPFLALQDSRRAWRYSAVVTLPMLVFYGLFFPGALWRGLDNAPFFHHFPVPAWIGLNLALAVYLIWEWGWGRPVVPPET